MKPSRDIARLIEIMAALRTPGTGCPWDLEQTFATIAPYTIEEAYEVADAIDRGDLDDLRDELGDLLLQVVFHARMAEEQGAFAFGDVVEAITEKLIRRHPHVFGEQGRAGARARSKVKWDAIKAEEKAAARRKRGRGPAPGRDGALAGVPPGLPALARALKLQEKAGKVGFDWNDPKAVLAKIREETDEIEAEIAAGDREQGRGRSRRSAVRRGQSGAASRCRSRDRAAHGQSEIRTALRLDRAGAGRRRARGRGCDARRDGRAVGCREGEGRSKQSSS